MAGSLSSLFNRADRDPERDVPVFNGRSFLSKRWRRETFLTSTTMRVYSGVLNAECDLSKELATISGWGRLFSSRKDFRRFSRGGFAAAGGLLTHLARRFGLLLHIPLGYLFNRVCSSSRA
jgi:hypothetical protein